MMRIEFELTREWELGVPIEVECSECEKRMPLSRVDTHAENHGADVIGLHIGPDLSRDRGDWWASIGDRA